MDDGWTEEALAALQRTRGWSPKAIARLHLTYDPRTHTVGIPIVDQSGAELGFLRYLADPAHRNGPMSAEKMRAPAGVPRQLSPPPETIGDTRHVLVTEGEGDAVTAWSAGHAAVGVPGTNGWKPEYATRFTGRHWTVFVVFDCDHVGRTAAAKVAASLLDAGVDVRLVDLDPGRSDGYDLTDFLKDGRGLAELLANAGPPKPPKPDRLYLTERELRDLHETENTTGWVWDQLVAPGYLTRLDGRPKVAGKSTLLFALCRAIREGEPFLGLDTREVVVAYASEQRWKALRHKLIEPYGMPPFMHLYHDDPGDLNALIARTLDEIDQHGVELVIIDTASKWMHLPEGGRSDADVMRSQMALLEMLAQQVAVVVADYTRKGEFARGEGTLGATEQVGRADILIELRKPDPEQSNVRRLVIDGRSDAPEQIDYAMAEGGDLNRCDLDAMKAEDLRADILRVLGETSVSGSQLATVVGRRKETVLYELELLRADGLVWTVGRGPKATWAIAPDSGTTGTAGTDGTDTGEGLF